MRVPAEHTPSDWLGLVPGRNRADADWAYLAARTGWTPSQLEELTAAQTVLLVRAIEERDAELTEAIRDAVLNALANGMAKRGSKAVALFEPAPDRVRLMGRAEAIGKMAAIEASMG